MDLSATALVCSRISSGMIVRTILCQPILISLLIMAFLVSKPVLAADEHIENLSKNIGIPDNRYPYSYKDKNNQPAGILISQLHLVCKKASYTCNLVFTDFTKGLNNVTDLQLDALLIVDSIILPEHDEVKVTQPLCKSTPVFVRKVRLTLQKTLTTGDLKDAVIGVTQESLFQLYAIDNYYDFTIIRPYKTAESAIFDIFSERIDTLFIEEAFYDARIGNTLLGHRHNHFWLKKFGTESVQLPDTLMTLVLRHRDEALWDRISVAITKQTSETPCNELLPRQKAQDAKISNPKTSSDED